MAKSENANIVRKRIMSVNYTYVKDAAKRNIVQQNESIKRNVIYSNNIY